MGLQIALIVTKPEGITVPVEVTHFRKNGQLVLPIEQLDGIASLVYGVFDSGITDVWHYEDATDFDLKYLSTLKKLGIHTFVGISSSKGYQDASLAVINGEVIRDSIYDSETEGLSQNRKNPFALLGMQEADLYDYHNYEGARHRYEKENNLLGTAVSIFSKGQ